jgi:hypothetical protein
MELNINELENLDELNELVNDNMYDQIPENKPIKIIKKNAPPPITPKSAIKKVTRPHVPQQKPNVSYDDILTKMGMFVAEGQLHLLDNQPPEVQEQIRHQIKKTKVVEEHEQQVPQNSYIYNKYFSNEMQNEGVGPRVPRNLEEYRDMLLHDLIQKQRIRQMKSTKLIMPTSNINFAPYSSHNMNKLFSFSNR